MKKIVSWVIKNLILILSLSESVFLLFCHRPMREGLDDCIFLLPLTVFVCFLAAGQIYRYHRSGIGLKIFYALIVIRYLVLPFTIYLSYGETDYYMSSAVSPSSYHVAVLVMCIELIIAVAVIARYYPRVYRLTSVRQQPLPKPPKTITPAGWMVLAFLFIIVLIRINYVIPSMNIILFKHSDANAGVWYEDIIISCIKAFLFAGFMQYVMNHKSSTHQLLYYLIAVLLAFLNFGMYFGSNRAYIVMTLIATLTIYFYVYPEYRKISAIVLVPAGLFCVATMFVNKQFGESLSSFSVTQLSAKKISNLIELYVGGPWNYASGFEATVGRYLPDLGMMTASTINKFALANIPGFRWLRGIESGCGSCYPGSSYAWEVYQSSMGRYGHSQILSGPMEILMIFGRAAGWLLSVVYQFVAVRLLIKADCIEKTVLDVKAKYLFAWLGIMLGMHWCYSPLLLLWIWSKFALFYGLILLVNNRIVIKVR